MAVSGHEPLDPPTSGRRRRESQRVGGGQRRKSFMCISSQEFCVHGDQTRALLYTCLLSSGMCTMMICCGASRSLLTITSSPSCLPASTSSVFSNKPSKTLPRRNSSLGFARNSHVHVAQGAHFAGAPQCRDALGGNAGGGGAWLDFWR